MITNAAGGLILLTHGEILGSSVSMRDYVSYKSVKPRVEIILQYPPGSYAGRDLV